MRDGSPEPEPRPGWPAPSWLAYALLFGLSLSLGGYRSLDGDQAYRLPILLHQQDPTVFANDPFVRAFDAFNPHQGYLTLLDGPSRLIGLPASLFLFYAATYAVLCLGIRALARAVWPASGEWVGVVAVGLILLADAGNIGTNHLFEPMLLDRLIAFGLVWGAIALFVSGGRSLAAPVLIGLAGLVHPSLGIQLGMLLGGGWLLALICPCWLAIDRRSAVMGLGLLGLALLPTVLIQAPQKAALFEGLDPETFRLLSFTVQGPQHMLPHLWRPLQWLAWGGYLVLTALVMIGWNWSLPRIRLATLLGIVLMALAGAWAAVEVVQEPRITIFQPFRMATVVRGLCLVLIADRVRSLAFRGDFAGILRATLIVSGLGSDGAMVVAVLTELSWSLGERLGSPSRGKSSGWLRLSRTPTDDDEPPAQATGAEPTHPFNGLIFSRRGDETIPGGTGSAYGSRVAIGKRSGDPSASLACDSRVPSTDPVPPFERSGQLTTPPAGRGETTPAPPASPILRGQAFGIVGALLVLIGGIAYLIRHDPRAGEVPLLLGIEVALLIGVVRLRIRTLPRWTFGRAVRLTSLSFAVPVLALVAALLPTDIGPDGFASLRDALISRCRFGESPTDDVERLALWAREHTPPDARFVGPPGPKTFRLWSRREVAFNRAASPYDGTGLADWAARFADHVGFQGDVAEFARAYLADRHTLERRYQEMPAADRASLAIRQGADFVLAAAPGSDDPPGPSLELLHADGRYAIYQVRDTGQGIEHLSRQTGDDSPLR